VSLHSAGGSKAPADRLESGDRISRDSRRLEFGRPAQPCPPCHGNRRSHPAQRAAASARQHRLGL